MQTEKDIRKRLIRHIRSKVDSYDFYYAFNLELPNSSIPDFLSYNLRKDEISIYEIKCSRQDYLNDFKYELYMKYANWFFFTLAENISNIEDFTLDKPGAGLLVSLDKQKKQYSNSKNLLKYCISPEFNEVAFSDRHDILKAMIRSNNRR